MQVQLEWKLATKTSGHRRAIIGGGVDELVYTLNDLSSRLSILASTLNAYWGKGAA